MGEGEQRNPQTFTSPLSCYTCLILIPLQDLLLSPSEGSESELSETEQLQIMLELQYKRRKKWRRRLKRDRKVRLVLKS